MLLLQFENGSRPQESDSRRHSLNHSAHVRGGHARLLRNNREQGRPYGHEHVSPHPGRLSFLVPLPTHNPSEDAGNRYAQKNSEEMHPVGGPEKNFFPELWHDSISPGRSRLPSGTSELQFRPADGTECPHPTATIIRLCPLLTTGSHAKLDKRVRICCNIMASGACERPASVPKTLYLSYRGVHTPRSPAADLRRNPFDLH